MNKIIRLNENDLKGIVERSAKRLIKESVDIQQIKYAQKELVKIGTILSSVGLRLEDTPYRQQYKMIYHELSKLNSALIKHLKGGVK
jgi:hypothetical protein